MLRKCRLRERLRAARAAMQQQFPLSEQLWLEWLDDEAAAAKSPKAVVAVEKLFESAVQDYLSIALWAKYLGCASPQLQGFIHKMPNAVRRRSAVVPHAFVCLPCTCMTLSGVIRT